MTFLIDGYNLMYAVGMARRSLPAKGLERARTRFLDWLADAVADRDDTVRVVFDAQNGPMPSSEYGHRGVRVRFAFRQTADELIEELLHTGPFPAGLSVVSNDNQVREDARRRRCGVLTCQAFVDWVVHDRPHNTPPPPEADKPDQPDATADEMAAWLAAFSAPPKKRR